MRLIGMMLLSLSLLLQQQCFAQADRAATAEREQIDSLLKEITYLKEVAIQMQKTYGARNAKIRFNYQALIAQLTATENGIKEYLNARAEQIYLTPPAPLNRQLFEVRKN